MGKLNLGNNRLGFYIWILAFIFYSCNSGSQKMKSNVKLKEQNEEKKSKNEYTDQFEEGSFKSNLIEIKQAIDNKSVNNFISKGGNELMKEYFSVGMLDSLEKGIYYMEYYEDKNKLLLKMRHGNDYIRVVTLQ